MQSRPVRVEVPIGISRQAKMRAMQKPFTFQSGGKMVPKRMNQTISGMIAIATVEMVEPSYRPELLATIRFSSP